MIAPVDLVPGQLLGRYELLIAVAQGGMGTVWAARERGPAGDKIVAVKTMLPSLSSDPRCKRMFLTESRIASRIKHPNVCAILDQGEQNGVLYFVMEWIDGDALVALLGGSTRKQGRPLPLPVAVRIAIESARGLHAAHELRDDGGALVGLVHRDVSPHNILITRDGSVKIADFGVAKAMAHADNPTTNTGHMKGKILFMAPEQVYSEQLDRRSDIFALGIVLYQLTTGTHPFAASHDLATMARIARPEPVDPPSTLVPDYPPALEAAVVRALAKDPAERFATMAELAEALEAVDAALGGRREEVTGYIRDALASFECESWAIYEGGDHLIFVGRVVHLERVSHADPRPLVFSGGRYRRLDPGTARQDRRVRVVIGDSSGRLPCGQPPSTVPPDRHARRHLTTSAGSTRPRPWSRAATGSPTRTASRPPRRRQAPARSAPPPRRCAPGSPTSTPAAGTSSCPAAAGGRR